MKKVFLQKVSNALFMFTMLGCFLLLAYCTDQSKENTRKSLTEFKAYVREHKDATVNYMDEKWEDLEKEYDQKKSALDKNMSKMDEEMKNSYRETVAEWDEFKADYQAKLKEKDDMKHAESLKRTIVPSDVSTDLSNVSGKNVALVFDHFVTTVDNNKESYSKEEWININNYWKSLNDVAGRLDDKKEISAQNNRKIDGLRIKYMAIKALNKPFAESEK